MRWEGRNPGKINPNGINSLLPKFWTLTLKMCVGNYLSFQRSGTFQSVQRYVHLNIVGFAKFYLLCYQSIVGETKKSHLF